jgi:hypothetical protein
MSVQRVCIARVTTCIAVHRRGGYHTPPIWGRDTHDAPALHASYWARYLPPHPPNRGRPDRGCARAHSWTIPRRSPRPSGERYSNWAGGRRKFPGPKRFDRGCGSRVLNYNDFWKSSSKPKLGRRCGHTLGEGGEPGGRSGPADKRARLSDLVDARSSARSLERVLGNSRARD